MESNPIVLFNIFCLEEWNPTGCGKITDLPQLRDTVALLFSFVDSNILLVWNGVIDLDLIPSLFKSLLKSVELLFIVCLISLKTISSGITSYYQDDIRIAYDSEYERKVSRNLHMNHRKTKSLDNVLIWKQIYLIF